MIFYEYYADIPGEKPQSRERKTRHVPVAPSGRSRRSRCEWSRKVKWKLAQNRDRAMRERLITRLRARGRPTDAGAADALQWTLDREAAK